MRAVKRLGQVILKDKRIISFIVDSGEVKEGDTVLEIGAGPGNLTSEILSRGANVISIEKSTEYYQLLSAIFKEEIERGRLTLINGDALKVDFPRFNKVISNIPYSISSPITFKLLKYSFDLGIIMYQKEFAQRLVASPGTPEYSRITVNVYYFADVKILRNVKRGSFYPIPDVDSSIVKILPRRKFSVIDEKHYFELTRILFSQRRKTIRKIIGMDVPYGDRRVEELTPEQIAEISDYIILRRNENKIFQ
ncbi:MAG: 16S rRNA (adenine(1518)-N(6)/adenine(1519)-N(6))-dimethyltransferase RsmA [Thermoplasmata archaeon]